MNKILIIDDQENNLRKTKDILNKSIPDSQLLIAQTCIKGLEIAIKEQPDTILLDVVIPEMDAFKVCKKLKSDKRTKYIPLIFVSDFQKDSESKIKVLKSGADVFLTKPIDPLELAAQVSSMIRIRKAEKKLLESEIKLKNIIENSTNTFYSHTTDHQLTYLSPHIEDILGFKPQEAMIKWTELVSDNPINEKGFELTEKAIKTSKAQPPYELELIHKNGKKVWVEVREAPLIENGKTISIIGALTDITERKNKEQVQKVIYNISKAVSTTDNLDELIRLIQKQLGTLIDTTNFYIALYNEKTDTLSLPFMSDEKDEFESFPAGKTLTYYVIKTKKSFLATKKEYKILEQTGEIDSYGTDSEIWLGVPLKIEGVVTGVLAVQSYTDENAYNESDVEMLEFVSDQTSILIDRKKTMEGLKAALEKAKESDRLKSAFLSTMSHELRTPLNAIIGFSEIIDEDSQVDEILDFCKTINNSGTHLLGLVEDIFDISLLESGEVKIQKREFMINEFLEHIQNTIETKQKKEDKQDIEIRFKYLNKDLQIYSDKSKLKQILINLLKNALKFTTKGYIEFGYSKEVINNEPIIKFYVKDTGIGINKDKQDIIFDIFRQGDDSQTRKYEGAGIGLSVAYQLTELLGGKMWVESDPDTPDIHEDQDQDREGKGTTFHFTLPYTKNIVTITNKSNSSTNKSIGYPNKTVLVAEDVESNYLYIEALLKRLKIEILWAKTGNEAISICKENPNIDMVLMDILLPEINGYESTKQIKKFRPELPIIAQTAFAMYGDSEKAFEAGCDDYLAKPIKKQQITDLIGKYFD